MLADYTHIFVNCRGNYVKSYHHKNDDAVK